MPKRELEVFDDPEAFRRAVAGKSKKPRQKPREAQELPRAPHGIGDQHNALQRLAERGYSIRFDTGIGFSAWNASTGQRTSAHGTYAAAIAAAEAEKESTPCD
jgi:hypothetical protein